MEPSSKLPGVTLKRFQEALVAAFPTRNDLAQMVRVGLDENLEVIAPPTNLASAVFELIRWAEAQGRIEELVAAARTENPGNPMLRAFAEERGKQAPDPSAPSPTWSPGANVEPAYGNTATRALAEQLEAARLRKKALEDAGASAAEVDREILELRRRLREGGQLRAGDALGNGRYLLLKQIGRGGFASVWGALDRERGERVALKVLHPDQASERSRRQRFFRGARVMAGLQHEAIVRVLSPYEKDDGYYYFVMELVQGEDLHHAVVGGRLPKEKVVPLILRVGGALAVAHARGIVHRDVKPANILIDSAGAPKLTDFDLVAAKDTTGGTRTGALGTFLFTAPEQIRMAKDADARADVYGLGMTAIFCFHGDELPDIMMRTPDKVINELTCDEAIKSVLTRAIEIDPELRHADARAFDDALEAAMAPPDVTYSRFVNGIYAEHFGTIEPTSSLKYVYQQAGKVYRDIYQKNVELGKIAADGSFDHTLAYLIAGRIRATVNTYAVRQMAQSAIAAGITNQILAYLQHSERPEELFNKWTPNDTYGVPFRNS